MLIWSTSFDVYKYVIKATNFEAGLSSQDWNKQELFTSFAFSTTNQKNTGRLYSVLVKNCTTMILQMTNTVAVHATMSQHIVAMPI